MGIVLYDRVLCPIYCTVALRPQSIFRRDFLWRAHQQCQPCRIETRFYILSWIAASVISYDCLRRRDSSTMPFAANAKAKSNNLC